MITPVEQYTRAGKCFRSMVIIGAAVLGAAAVVNVLIILSALIPWHGQWHLVMMTLWQSQEMSNALTTAFSIGLLLIFVGFVSQFVNVFLATRKQKRF